MQYKLDKVYIRTPKYQGWYYTENFYLIDIEIKKQLIIGDENGT